MLCGTTPCIYKIAEEQINNGLSPFARFILGVFALLFGGIMVWLYPTMNNGSVAFGIFCFLISVACFTTGRIGQFIGSIIGCTLFFLSIWYFYSELTGGAFISSSRSKPSVVNSIFFFFAFGIPGAAYAMKAKFGWRKSKSDEEIL